MRTLLCWVLLLAATIAHPQTDTAHWRIPGPVDLFTTDDLGGLYVLRGNDLFLYDRNGGQPARNSFNTFGPISAVSAYASLKPKIFSRDQGQLALLDNTLSIRGNTMNLARSGHPWVELACTGVQDRLWLFNGRDLTLVRVDGMLNVQASSGRLDQVLGFTPQPTYMEEADDRLYLVDPGNGVLVFDLFGTFIRTCPLPARNACRCGKARCGTCSKGGWCATTCAPSGPKWCHGRKETTAWPCWTPASSMAACTA
ncbi:MAG TPA: hypothetical protein PLL18_09075 [Flavobacteriales bacterium]|nr:hypothetical protein [Flavobacteriales bacterium]